MKRVVIFDMLNQFMRNWHVNPTLDKEGYPIGGTIGSLKVMQKIIREFKPSMVVVAWDGEQRSSKRRRINKAYKADRKKSLSKLNFNSPLTEEELIQNKANQHVRLAEYLNCLPVLQLVEKKAEADDIIAHVVTHKRFDNWQKIIVSSDKDFLQLVTEGDVILYRPVEDKFYSTKEVLERYSISSCNFALAKAIVGDRSDNIEGVSGIGFKTLAKRFPQFSGSNPLLLNEVTQIANKKLSEGRNLKAYQNLVADVDRIKDNYKIVQLDTSILNSHSIRKLDKVIEEFQPVLEEEKFKKLLVKDGVDELYFSQLLEKSKNLCQNI